MQARGPAGLLKAETTTEEKDSVVAFSVGRITQGWGRNFAEEKWRTKALKGLDDDGFGREKRGPEMHLGNY